MIDRSKNICYVIRVPYTRDNKLYFQKFLSLHSAFTKHFIAFQDEYFREVLQLDPKCIGEWEKDGLSTAHQETISWESFKYSEGVAEAVVRGITNREKCW